MKSHQSAVKVSYSLFLLSNESTDQLRGKWKWWGSPIENQMFFPHQDRFSNGVKWVDIWMKTQENKCSVQPSLAIAILLYLPKTINTCPKNCYPLYSSDIYLHNTRPSMSKHFYGAKKAWENKESCFLAKPGTANTSILLSSAISCDDYVLSKFT